MAGVFTLKALGLNSQPNSLEVPPGSMSVAKNVNITRTDVVEPRRGFKVYGNSFGTSSDTAKQLFSYKLRILRHFSNVLQFDSNGSGNFQSFNGSILEAVTGQRIKSVESNGNLYLTTSDGIKKISALTAADLTTASGVVINAGAVKAVDVTGKVNYIYGDTTDFLPQDSAVSYRVVWGYKDNNNNLLLGAPSQLIQVYNPLLNLLLPDYMKVLGALDSIGQAGSFINDKDYVNVLGLGIDATGHDLYENLLALTTKLDNNLFFADNYIDLGTWNASTNTPTIRDNINSINDTYVVSVAGTQDLGHGPIAYSINDLLVYDGTTWNKDIDYSFKGAFDASEQFLGQWSASSNSPSLVDGTGVMNTYYRVNSPATRNLGSGPQTFATGDYVKYNGSTWLKDTNARFPLQNGVGNQNDLYLVGIAGTVYFNVGEATPNPISLNVNDFLTYNNGVYVKLTPEIEVNNPDTSKATSFKFLNYWNASTNTPTIHDTVVKNGDFYTVSVGGTQDLGNGPIVFSPGDRVLFNEKFWTIKNYVNLGTWNASTNTPTLVNGTGTEGDYYIVNVAGTQNLGLGPVNYKVNDRVMYVSGQWVVNTFNIANTAPLSISSVNIDSGICTITFSSGDPTQYLISGSSIFLDGFTPTTGALNGAQTVASVTNTTITFNTTAVGDINGNVDVDATASIHSNDFRSIAQPPAPATFPTNNDLVAQQTYLQNIINQLLLEPTQIISNLLSTQYIATLEITTAANVTLTITIPAGINSNYFYQIYRSQVFSATGVQVLSTDVVPNDELQQVFEAFPTSAQLSAGQVIVTDIVPDNFRGANLYTNASTGEGILQANNAPPFATDINTFKGSVFYSNTHILQYMALSLLGVQNMITDYNNGITPTLTISTQSSTNTYKFVTGLPEISTITCNAGSTLAASGTASYFDFNAGNHGTAYRFWYNIGTAVAPSSGGKTLVPILATALDSSSVIANKTRDVFNTINYDFSAVNSTNVVTVTCLADGPTIAPVDGTTGFVFLVTQAGQGEDASIKQVLLSTNISPAIAVQETALSLTRVVNLNNSENVYLYYTSGFQQVPGQMVVEARNLGVTQFFFNTNDANTGNSFSPSLAPTLQISSIATGGPTANLITTSTPHGLTNLSFIFISGSNSTPSIDGYQQITYVSTTTFRVNATITGSGTKGGIIPFTVAESSASDSFPNRIFYSKLQQPEAVPSVNFFDVGAKDKAILRIYPLRDSLFIFKQDGIYRISGESIPFNLGLFDSSCILIAPDSVSSLDNVIYGWTRTGISSITESGTRNISRPIDVNLLPLATSSFTNFAQSTWGIGYESDKSYSIYTLTKTSDTNSTQGWKYNTLTNAWTYTDKSSVCGVVNFIDDRLYLGPGDINFIEQERKNYDRTDHTDREYIVDILPNSFGTSLMLNDVTNVLANDVIVQSQPFSIYTFNALLKKIDFAPVITNKNFYSTLAAIPGSNMRNQLVLLAQKLDVTGLTQTDYAASIAALNGNITSISTGPVVTIHTSSNHGLISGRKILLAATDSTPTVNGEFIITVTSPNQFTIDPGFVVTTAGTTGTWATVTSDFTDLQVCYNEIISKLNADSILAVNNFKPVTEFVEEEVLITTVNTHSKTITLAQLVPYIQGEITVYSAIESEVVYSPYTFGGDPISLKHIREAQFLFDSLAFTGGILNFATDLIPAFQPVPFVADGPGLFGLNGGFGSGFFGGASDSAPIRTYIPRNCQRCRYMVVGFHHSAARDKWAMNGITLTGEVIESSRAYR